jgi:tetratricopeptide (TPR) repeat protein
MISQGSQQVEPNVFETLHGEGTRAIEAGRFDEAAAIFARALAWAQERGEGACADNALCNLAAVAIQLGRGAEELPPLRRILMKNEDVANCRLAAYQISLHYERAKDYKKSLFYARLALERSKLLDCPSRLASSHNQVGNALLGESRVDEATEEYERALEAIPADHEASRSRILNNLGYCRVLKRRFDEGYRLLYESLALQRPFGNKRLEVLPRLDLCFAHLETGRLLQALREGRKALRLAEEIGEPEFLKNALYLLGEAANLSGEEATAQIHFARLQREFFPGESYLAGFLLAVDVRKLVNLHA